MTDTKVEAVTYGSTATRVFLWEDDKKTNTFLDGDSADKCNTSRGKNILAT